MASEYEAYRRIGRIRSPALRGELVAFNRCGFRHLIQKGRRYRPKSERKRRFALLKDAERIIKDPLATVLPGRKSMPAPRASFWVFREKQPDGIVTVVVRQFPRGIKHFFSVYKSKQKSAP